MSGLVLVAASGLAREVLSIEALAGRYDDLVIVDDDRRLWGTGFGEAKVLGGLDLVHELPQHDVLLCAGQGRVRREMANRLLSSGLDPSRFSRVGHPRASVGRGCGVGAGSILLAQVTLTGDVMLGRHVVVMPGATLTHDDIVDDYATVCAGVSLGGRVRVGAGAYVGMNACVREGVRIGRDAVLGMGSALLEDLPPKQTWAGVPARQLQMGSP